MCRSTPSDYFFESFLLRCEARTPKIHEFGLTLHLLNLLLDSDGRGVYIFSPHGFADITMLTIIGLVVA